MPRVSSSDAMVVQRAGEGAFRFGGSTVRFLSEGAPGIPEFYEERSVRGDSAPLHRHPWPSWEMVLSGELLFVVEGEEHRLGPGDAVYIPGGVTHSYLVLSDEAWAVGTGTSDGRFAALQMGAAPQFDGPGPPDMAVVGRLADEAGVEILGPPLSLPG